MLSEITDSQSAAFERLTERADFTSDAAFRASYLAHHLRAFLADQIRVLRGELSQREFGELIGKPQSVISRLEDEEYGKVTLQTLIDIATKLDIGLLVRFVDFPKFLRETNDFSENSIAPAPYNREAVNQMLLMEKQRQDMSISDAATSAVDAFSALIADDANRQAVGAGAKGAIFQQGAQGVGAREGARATAADNLVKLDEHRARALDPAA